MARLYGTPITMNAPSRPTYAERDAEIAASARKLARESWEATRAAWVAAGSKSAWQQAVEWWNANGGEAR